MNLLIETAHAHIQTGDLAAAFPVLQSILARDPDSIPAYLAMGRLLYANNDFIACAGCYHKVLILDPSNPSAEIYLGLACMKAGDAHQALYHAKTVNLSNLSAIDHGNLSALYLDLGRFRDALRHVDVALTLTPNEPELHCRRGVILLTLGQYKDGWREYEWRRGRPVAQLQAGNWTDTSQTVEALYGLPPDKPYWNGTHIDHLVVHYEHGFGDTIQWSRFVRLAVQRCNRLSLVVPTSMVALMRDSFGPAIIVRDSLPITFDAYVWLDSLPMLFNADTRINANTPYLRAGYGERWHQELAPYTRLRVGLVWAGRPGLETDRWRSLPCDKLDSILKLDADFFSLQKGNAETDPRIINLAPRIDTWQDTAGAISALDLIISVDTSVVHLAGAMGKPVWLLNRYNTCWRWLLNRPTSPWYPSMRIFRQPAMGDWNSVMIQVRKALIKRLSEHVTKARNMPRLVNPISAHSA